MKIRLKTLKMLNFKGQKDLLINFNEKETNICGANATGKTTIFDAFTWLLFGKDSQDRATFNIKTLDANGKAIERIPHEVSGVLEIDGELISLRKVYEEKWVRTRGQSADEFKGHTTSYFVNEVPCSEKEYNEKISNICAYDTFKLITNPQYFTAQPKDFQRSMLFSQIDGITNEEVAGNDTDFNELIQSLKNTKLEDYKKEISAKKTRIKKEIQSIPARIDENKRGLPEACDFEAIEAQITEKQALVAEIDEQINDVYKSVALQNKKRSETQSKIHDLETKKAQLIFEIEKEALVDYHTKLKERNELFSTLESLNSKLTTTKKLYIDALSNKETLEGDLSKLREQYSTINKEQLSFDENQFNCPACKRPLEVNDIETKQQNLLSGFNKHKADRLEQNKNNGLKKKQELDENIQFISDKLAAIEKCNEDISILQKDELYHSEPQKPDTKHLIENDVRIIELVNQINDLQRDLSDVEQPDTAELKTKKQQLSFDLQQLNLRLNDRDIIKATNDRITELENELRNQSQELATLEGIEYTILKFSKAKIELVEDKINSLFVLVKFKMFDTQINGGEVETCEAMVNGVPYSNLNNAMRINAGLDIINAFCLKNNTFAPIFIDNRESVNEIIHCESQIINLVVTTDKTLKNE